MQKHVNWHEVFFFWKFIKFMFLLLHQPVTKYQIPNLFLVIFFVVGIQKRKMENRQQTTYLWIVTKQQKYKKVVFYIWFVVTGWCNERSKSLNLFSHRDHPFKTLANFHYSWPLPPSIGFITAIRRQICTIFDPSPLQIANVLNGWSL